MTLATGIIFYRVMSFGRSPESKRIFAYLLTFLLCAIAVYHCLVVEVAVHQGSFVLMVVIVGFRTANLIKTRIKDEQVKARMNRMARSGSVTIFLAWVLWNVDNVICSTLRSVRESVGIPWGFLFELHGWWHILTAVAVYIYFVLIEHLTAEIPVEESIEASSVYAWPVLSSLKGKKSGSTVVHR
ncbi:hypothetical protein MMC11_008503 [Xylographa trunciseda]|nr:hypothetical protein [Xylographa trunciseda]